MRKYISGLILFHVVLLSQAPVVENVHFEQRTDGTLIVDIYYDVTDPSQDVIDIRIEVSGDSGRTWDLPCSHLTGDVGYGILSGTGKHVVWDFYADNPDTSGSGYCIQVIAKNNVVVDIDGNRYETVQIGNQIWMAENLKVTHYRNGDEIPNITDYRQWSETSSGALCEVENNPVYIPVYGLLYNWYAADDERGLAPEGWHVPTDDDWIKLLVEGLGLPPSEAESKGGAGWNDTGKLKETGTLHWKSPNLKATNESGFTGLPAGYRQSTGYFDGYREYAHFWSCTEEDYKQALCRGLYYNNSTIYHNVSDKHKGGSIRCVKDPSVVILAPTLLSPEDGSTEVSIIPILSWNASQGSSSYDLQVAASENFINCVCEIPGLTSIWHQTTSLTEDVIYYWRVRGRDSAGNAGPWSEVWSFTPSDPLLPAPILLSPVNGCMMDDRTPCLDWGDVLGAVNYKLEVDNDIGFGSPEIEITGLEVSSYTVQSPFPDGTFYWRVRARDSEWNSGEWSDVRTFNIQSFSTMTDLDGNTYRTIKIGDQWWMAENLKVTHYRNGDQIPDETNNPDWGYWEYLTTGAYCTYKNIIDDEIYGYLYNWYAVNDSRNIAPPGWHVPTSAEWAILYATLGEGVNRGGKLKATGSIENGTGLWHLPNTGASDEVGFSALPAGWRSEGPVSQIGYNAYFWSATDAGYRDDDELENFWDICERGWAINLFYDYSSLGWYDYCQCMGFSVRLVRD